MPSGKCNTEDIGSVVVSKICEKIRRKGYVEASFLQKLSLIGPGVGRFIYGDRLVVPLLCAPGGRGPQGVCRSENCHCAGGQTEYPGGGAHRGDGRSRGDCPLV